jgi:Transposase, Mutator family
VALNATRSGAATTETTWGPLNNVITIDDERIKNHLDRIVRGSVEETLRTGYAMRSATSAAGRVGIHPRAIMSQLQTKSGEVRLKVPKLWAQTFETAIIQRYRRRESSVDEALWPASGSGQGHHGGSVGYWCHRQPCGPKKDLPSPGAIGRWSTCSRPSGSRFPMCRFWLAIGVNSAGYREICGICDADQLRRLA